ncbi:MAG: hypothetical protein R3F43_09785 [bacterium]
MRKTPRAARQRIEASVSLTDLAFSETFYGYHRRDRLATARDVKALSLLVGSRVALWHLLVTSGEFGLEREAVEKRLLDALPVVDLAELPSTVAEQVDPLFDALVEAPTADEVWARIDDWAAQAYGLQPADLAIIDDTLRFGLPYAECRDRATAVPTVGEVVAFGAQLVAQLGPLLARFGRQLSVEAIAHPADSPWRAINLQAQPIRGPDAPAGPDTRLLAVADRQGTTEVLVVAEGAIQVTRLAHARHWTRSQAILCARRLALHHLDALVGA